MENRLTAVVLCGGFSSRMGRDKGSIPTGNSIWAVQAAAKAILLNLDVYYSVREEQIPLYTPWINSAQFIPDNNAFEGPLKGLMSAHQRLPGQDILLLACDMTSLQCDTVYTVIREYVSCDNEFYAYHEDGFYQPFCAVYTAEGLQKALARQPLSLQDLLKEGDTLSLTPPENEQFLNQSGVLPLH